MSSSNPASQVTPQFLPTRTTYDLWAPIYDNEANALQALDTHLCTETLIPSFLKSLATAASSASSPPPGQLLHIIDLGCGTGRATLLLLSALQAPSNASLVAQLTGVSTGDASTVRGIHITCLDESEGMLAVAKGRVPAETTLRIVVREPEASNGTAEKAVEVKVTTSFAQHSILTDSTDILSTLSPPIGIISTLVLEHIPLETYFTHVLQLFQSGAGAASSGKRECALLVTNMHEDMANQGSAPPGNEGSALHPRTAANFKDPASGTKIRGTSYAHTVQDMRDAIANVHGASVGGEGIMEREVTEEMVQAGIVGSRGRKWVGVKCWVGCIVQYQV